MKITVKEGSIHVHYVRCYADHADTKVFYLDTNAKRFDHQSDISEPGVWGVMLHFDQHTLNADHEKPPTEVLFEADDIDDWIQILQKGKYSMWIIFQRRDPSNDSRHEPDYAWYEDPETCPSRKHGE